MFVALANGSRVHAANADRAGQFCCPAPDCGGVVTLKRGRIRIAHFAHKPGATCLYGSGETAEHDLAKSRLFQAFADLGREVELEPFIPVGQTYARPDLVVRRGNPPVAIEIQHSPIAFSEIERRTKVLSRAGLAVWWIVPIDLDSLEPSNGAVERYSPRPYERWLHEFHGGYLWYFDTKHDQFIRASFKEHLLCREPFYEGDIAFDGDEYPSRRWVDLLIGTVFRPGERELVIRRRVSQQVRIQFGALKGTRPYFALPACRYIDLIERR